jgi:hypothetical protein
MLLTSFGEEWDFSSVEKHAMKKTRYEVITVERDPSLSDAGQLQWELNRLWEEAPHEQLVAVVPNAAGWLVCLKATIEGAPHD